VLVVESAGTAALAPLLPKIATGTLSCSAAAIFPPLIHNMAGEPA
jgi:hypothetical protein